MATTAPITRSKSRTSRNPNGITLHGGILFKSQKQHQCVLCDKTYKTRAWVKRHFATHEALPFIEWNGDNGEDAGRQFLPAYTHPSCWPAEENSWARVVEVTARKEGRGRPASDAPTAEYNAYRDQIDLAALTTKELAVKRDTRALRWWWWWVQTQGGALKNVTEDPGQGSFQINGDAGVADIEYQSQNTVPNNIPPPNPDAPTSNSSDPAPSINSGVERLAALTGPESTKSAERSWTLQGIKDGHFELIRVYEGGRLLPDTVLHFLSEVNTRYVQKKGEDFGSGRIMAIAVQNLISALTSDEDIKADYRALVDQRQPTELPLDDPAGDREERAGFRKDREEFFELRDRAILSWYAGGRNANNHQVMIQHLHEYARTLEDELGMSETQGVLNDNGDVVRQTKERRETWWRTAHSSF